MKRALILLLIVVMISVAFLPVNKANASSLTLVYDGMAHEYTGDIYSIEVNGEKIATDVPSVIINDRTLVPIRAIFEKLGADVYWVSVEQKAVIVLNSVALQIKVNDKVATINGKNFEMDVPAKIINDRIMVPVRFIAEHLNYKIGWYPDRKVVTVDSVQLGEIKVEQSDSYDTVIISSGPSKYYTVMELTDPDRIVIDIPNVEVPASGQIDVNGQYLNTVRYAQFDKVVARVVLDVSGKPKYEITNQDDRLIVKLHNMATPTTNLTICVDPGHGGSEPGASGYGYVEKDINLKLGLLLRDELKKCGFNVVMTREDDRYLSLYERGQIALKNNCNAIISVHFNASGTGAASGFEAIYTFNNESAKWIALSIFDEATKLGLNKRRVYTLESSSYPGRSYYGVLRESEPIPGVIAEGLFIDNANDVKFLSDPNFLKNLAKAYCRGICNAFGIAHVE